MNPYANPYLPPQAEAAVYRSGPDGPREGAMVPDTVLEHLRATRPWVTFLAVVGLLCAGLTVLTGLGVMVAGVAGKDGPSVAIAIGGGSVYLVLGAFYVLPSGGPYAPLRLVPSAGLIRDPRMELRWAPRSICSARSGRWWASAMTAVDQSRSSPSRCWSASPSTRRRPCRGTDGHGR